MARRVESQRIGQILRVLDIIRRERCSTPNEVRAARERATEAVARTYGVIEWTIRDKYTRQLELTADEFESLVLAWRARGDGSLRQHLEHHISDRFQSQDRAAIERFFAAD